MLFRAPLEVVFAIALTRPNAYVKTSVGYLHIDDAKAEDENYENSFKAFVE